MINTHQPMIEESIDPRGSQNRRNIDKSRASSVQDELMVDSQMCLEKTNSLNEERNNKSIDGMCKDNLDLGRSGDSQPGIRISQHRSAKPASYRDVFINSELRWENCFQEWGLQELEMEGSNDFVIG
ncbi:hypothetical protein C5167_049080 [Papaver somniferum]|uniref:Uncharacterized protein n=1 Tax=Papaver somniferum TaxID=3469 RepID=A0A4Y7KNT0_PAPSO|nr:hypothetical protein C5167_049080 [Papaver somniferum]